MFEREPIIFNIDSLLRMPDEIGNECEGLVAGHHDILCMLREMNIFGVQMVGIIGNIDFQ